MKSNLPIIFMAHPFKYLMHEIFTSPSFIRIFLYEVLYLYACDSIFNPIPKKGNTKECSNYCTIALISHVRKVMLKILQARLQHHTNIQMFKLVLEKAEEPEIKLPKPVGSSKKQESSRKTSIVALLTTPKPLTV